MSNILIAFRTHIWDENTRQLAYKLYSQTLSFDFVILFDETKGEIDTKPFEKIGHTSANLLSTLQLPHYPKNANNLHFNGDYPLYVLRHKKPNYKFYLMLENDASVNIDIENIFKECLHNNIDFIGQFTEIDKIVINRILKIFPKTGKVFFPFIAASGQLIDALYQSRLELATKPNMPYLWPYCEYFIGSFLACNPQFKSLPLQNIADLTNFTWKDHKHINDPRVYQKGTVVHPITSSITFIERNLMSNDIDTIFDEDSTLFAGIQFEDPQIFLPILEKRIKEKKRPDILIKFWNFALLKGWIQLPHPINIAFAKPAIQSSICAVSRFQDVKKDAALVVDGILEFTSRSHTAYEDKPWIMIDLEKDYEIRSILIYVRPDCHQNFCDFRIDTSYNNQEWSTIYKKIDGNPINSANMKPIVINVTTGHTGRFLKITQENAGWLHLNQVEVYSY